MKKEEHFRQVNRIIRVRIIRLLSEIRILVPVEASLITYSISFERSEQYPDDHQYFQVLVSFSILP